MYSLLAKMFGKVLIVCVLCLIASSDQDAVGSALRTVDSITATGYPAETHHVTTFDGYVLEMHRIPHGRNNGGGTSDRPVVFLMHGLMSASNAFIGLGADYSMAYNLADAGFDVWMGNARGNMYSRRHVSLDPDNDFQKYQFFDFTFEEIGLHDLPAMIDYALEYTQRPKLHYIGHSQGGTVFFVFLSLRLDYNAKIASAHLMGAVGYQEYFPNQALAASANMVDIIYSTALSEGIVELYPEFLDGLIPKSGYKIIDYCNSTSESNYLCELQKAQNILRDDSLPPEYTPAGGSIKQVAHYGQNIRDKLFRRYHHGTNGNNVNYGLEEPPLYNLGVITAEVTMHYTVNDDLLDERDVIAMAADMPNTNVRKVARESFLHTDFVGALDAKELVTDYIIEALRNTSDTADEVSEAGIEVIVIDNTTEAPDNPAVGDDGDNDDDSSAPDSAASVVINMYLIMLSLFLLYR